MIDLDCDGVLTTYEIEYFFEEQKQRIQSLSQELITFPDIMWSAHTRPNQAASGTATEHTLHAEYGLPVADALNL